MKTNSAPLHDPKEKFYRETFNRLGVPVDNPKPETWVHSLKCTKRTQKALDILNTWNEQWPNACTKCDSEGTHIYRDSVPYGSGNVSMITKEPCESCTEKGACPRCGEMILATEEQFEDFFDNEEPCSLCGWSWGKDKDDTRPEIPECYCWEA